ncbi:tetrapyrrole biosynthesis uroporphyrinogen III synthase [Cubamyces sp. BRFM 1775]|nr:tetrapyrrole biosynthesis uroporphyrinogen III synthase [Cubamyces sp. BRFM 1775]
MTANVLLLRSPSEDGGPDKYEGALHAQGYRAVSVPVLETVHKNLDKLAEVLRRRGTLPNGCTKYSGVIVTSARACEAWQEVVQRLSDSDDTSATDVQGSSWSTVPFYVVGAATASALSAIRAAHPTSSYVPHEIRGGAESGTAEKLAKFILSDLPEAPAPEGRTLLYLTGDKNRDTLPKILGEGGLKLESLQVYATQGSSRFEEDLKAALAEASVEGTERWWIVHFAPSAANTVAPTLEKYFDMPSAANASSVGRRARIACIGPTTATFLRNELHVEVAVVAEKPTPEALSEGIATWDHAHQW